MRWLKPGLTLILGLFMIFMGLQKLGPANPVFQFIAEQSGIALFEPAVRIATGVLEMLAGLLLLGSLSIKRLRLYGAGLSLAVIAGAVVFHLSPWLGISAPVAFAPDGSYQHSPMLFVMALVFGLMALALVWLDRENLPLVGKRASG